MATKYEFETEPLSHQHSLLKRTWDMPAFAVWWEQGTGKSKVTIDQAGILFELGRIGGMFIIAPDGVHRNWITEELRKHLPKRIAAKTASMIFYTKRAGLKAFAKEAHYFLKHEGFAVLAMTYDAIMTEAGRDIAKKFLLGRPCLMVVDEGKRIKTPNSGRTKRIIAAGRHAPYRRELEGTPVPNNPYDVYSQIRFVEPTFWAKHGIEDFLGFKTRFGNWTESAIRLPGGKLHKFLKPDESAPYKDLPLLNEWLAPITDRVLKDDVLDLPPKLYTLRTFELSRAQREAYNELRERAFTEVDGRFVTADMAMTLALRLQQITSGYIPLDKTVEDDLVDMMQGRDPTDRPDVHRFTPNPRADLLREICEDLSHPAIIFARFRADIDLIYKMLLDMSREVVRYDGATNDDQRADAVHRFQNAGDAQFFVGNPAVAGEGLTLTKARSVLYFNNSFKLSERLHSEDRPHRIGQTNPVNYTDFAAVGTVDIPIMETLRGKFEVANVVTGDRFKEWLNYAP